ncbi:hypothetical protein R1sor_010285 [Riccia sorocarpa]|uniref:Uncharacterized protein n=1 Tax=Riccia sorocarpa TaxID=122646 RepID=A0ABD3I0Y9_9MARC
MADHRGTLEDRLRLHVETESQIDTENNIEWRWVVQDSVDRCVAMITDNELSSLGLHGTFKINWRIPEIALACRFVQSYNVQAHTFNVKDRVETLSLAMIRDAFSLPEGVHTVPNSVKHERFASWFPHYDSVGKKIFVHTCTRQNWVPIIQVINIILLARPRSQELHGKLALTLVSKVDGEPALDYDWATLVLSDVEREIKALQGHIAKTENRKQKWTYVGIFIAHLCQHLAIEEEHLAIEEDGRPDGNEDSIPQITSNEGSVDTDPQTGTEFEWTELGADVPADSSPLQRRMQEDRESPSSIVAFAVIRKHLTLLYRLLIPDHESPVADSIAVDDTGQSDHDDPTDNHVSEGYPNIDEDHGIGAYPNIDDDLDAHEFGEGLQGLQDAYESSDANPGGEFEQDADKDDDADYEGAHRQNNVGKDVEEDSGALPNADYDTRTIPSRRRPVIAEDVADLERRKDRICGDLNIQDSDLATEPVDADRYNNLLIHARQVEAMLKTFREGYLDPHVEVNRSNHDLAQGECSPRPGLFEGLLAAVQEAMESTEEENSLGSLLAAIEQEAEHTNSPSRQGQEQQLPMDNEDPRPERIPPEVSSQDNDPPATSNANSPGNPQPPFESIEDDENTRKDKRKAETAALVGSSSPSKRVATVPWPPQITFAPLRSQHSPTTQRRPPFPPTSASSWTALGGRPASTSTRYSNSRCRVVDRLVGGIVFGKEKSEVAQMTNQTLPLYADVATADMAAGDVSTADMADADMATADMADADMATADMADADMATADMAAADVSTSDMAVVDVSTGDMANADMATDDMAGMRGSSSGTFVAPGFSLRRDFRCAGFFEARLGSWTALGSRPTSSSTRCYDSRRVLNSCINLITLILFANALCHYGILEARGQPSVVGRPPLPPAAANRGRARGQPSVVGRPPLPPAAATRGTARGRGRAWQTSARQVIGRGSSRGTKRSADGEPVSQQARQDDDDTDVWADFADYQARAAANAKTKKWEDWKRETFMTEEERAERMGRIIAEDKAI